jgi:UDP-N-acetylglucosamine 2-epimerase (hydrolysing)
MGEPKGNIFEIGSPDYDLMFREDLPDFKEVLSYYDIPFNDFGIIMFHPVTTAHNRFLEYAQNLVSALNDSGRNFVVIYPNNDDGSEHIIKSYDDLNTEKVRIFPSISFERFLVLLENARCIIGNSSAGVREAPCYGVPTVTVGTRQNNRVKANSIFDIGYSYAEISKSIQDIWGLDFTREKILNFGKGDSAERFIACLENERCWSTPIH